MGEAIAQRLEGEALVEAQIVKEWLQKEFDRRVYELHAYVSDLKEILGAPFNEWFIVPPVMNRTDFGYSDDLDFVVLLPPGVREDYEQIIALTQRYAGEQEVFFSLNFITQEELGELKIQVPEMHSWYQKKFREEKPKGRKLKYSGFSEQSKELEDRLRGLLSPVEKENLRQEYLRIAEEFIEETRKRVEVVAWTVSGSTVEAIEKFGFSSDLDLEILTSPKDED